METDGVIRVYVCPNKQCGDYYASSSMGKLEDQENTDIKNRPVSTRDRCPNCGRKRKLHYAWLIPEDHVREVLREAGIRP